MNNLKFGTANAKLVRLERICQRPVYTFSMLAGHTCPYAKNCLSKVIETETARKIVDGPQTEFRCYAASSEVLFPNLYRRDKHNSDLIKGCGNKVANYVELIERSLPISSVIRVHVAGDFITQNYFDAWLAVAANNSRLHFYAYTKSLPFWAKRIGMIPKNFVLTASYGGRADKLIADYNLRYARVVFSRLEAKQLKLKIDHTDELAYANGPSFALLLHGIQPKQSKAAKAWEIIRKNEGGYSRLIK